MRADGVARVLDVLDGAACASTAAGAIDALVGEQTRAHTDLDLAVDERDLRCGDDRRFNGRGTSASLQHPFQDRVRVE